MIAYNDNGYGQAVILLHGFCETKEMWRAFEKELSTHYRVLSPDLPGFGESRWLEDDLSLPQVASSLVDWMEELSLETPIIIGHSLGGYVALEIARLSPDLRGIGLFHSTAYPDDEEKRGVRDRTIVFVQKHGVTKFVDSFVPQLFPEERREELSEKISALLEIARTTPQETLLAYTKAMKKRESSIEVLKALTCPKLMIAGTLDTSVKIDDARKQAEVCKIDHFHELPATGHMGMFEREAETLAIVSDFLAAVTKS